MTEFDVPVKELEELAEILDSGQLSVLRDVYDHQRRTKQPLERYTSRIWFFPFGVHPAPGPIQIWRNGLSQWLDHEVKIFRVGNVHPLSVVVFAQETQPTDRVQASYIAAPQDS